MVLGDEPGGVSAKWEPSLRLLRGLASSVRYQRISCYRSRADPCGGSTAGRRSAGVTVSFAGRI